MKVDFRSTCWCTEATMTAPASSMSLVASPTWRNVCIILRQTIIARTSLPMKLFWKLSQNPIWLHCCKRWQGSNYIKTRGTISLPHLYFSTDYINTTADAGLSEDEFKALVDGLLSSVDLLSWIWNAAPGGKACIEYLSSVPLKWNSLRWAHRWWWISHLSTRFVCIWVKIIAVDLYSDQISVILFLVQGWLFCTTFA